MMARNDVGLVEAKGFADAGCLMLEDRFFGNYFLLRMRRGDGSNNIG